MEAGSLLREALLQQAQLYQGDGSDAEEQDIVWLDVYILPIPANLSGMSQDTLVGHLQRLAKLSVQINAFFQSQRQSWSMFQWYTGGDGPVFGMHATEGIPHLRAICHYGANVADVWIAVEWIRQFTLDHDEVAVECWDVRDGQVLLIEAANVLPSWVDSSLVGPAAMRHGCWVQQGRIHLIAPHLVAQQQQVQQEPFNLGLHQALQLLQRPGPWLKSPDSLQQAIRDCVAQWIVVVPPNKDPTNDSNSNNTVQPTVMQQHHHKAVIALPRPVAHLIRTRPDLVNAAIVAFAQYALHPLPKSNNHNSNNNTQKKNHSIDCQDWVLTSHAFSRTNYAMLRTLVAPNMWTTEDTVPPEYRSIEVRRLQRQCDMEATPHLKHAVPLGVRLVAGFNALLSMPQPSPSPPQQPSMSLLERRVLVYWPQFLKQGLGLMDRNHVQWLYDAWDMGPNHALFNIQDIMACHIVLQELTTSTTSNNSMNLTPLSHPEQSVAQQVQCELQKALNDETEFLIPRQDEVDREDDWMILTQETMEQQYDSRHGTTSTNTSTTTNQQAKEKQKALLQVDQLDHMLNSFQSFMVEKSGPEGVSHPKQGPLNSNNKNKGEPSNTPIHINPRIFLNLLHVVLDPTKSTEDIIFPLEQKQAALDDAFFSKEDYEAMEPADSDDDDDDNDAVDTDVVELMAAMDDELKGTAAASMAGDSRAWRHSGNVAGDNEEAGPLEESRILMSLLESLDAAAGGPGPVQSMMKAMGEEPPLV